MKVTLFLQIEKTENGAVIIEEKLVEVRAKFPFSRLWERELIRGGLGYLNSSTYCDIIDWLMNELVAAYGKRISGAGYIAHKDSYWLVSVMRPIKFEK